MRWDLPGVFRINSDVYIKHTSGFDSCSVQLYVRYSFHIRYVVWVWHMEDGTSTCVTVRAL